VDGRIAGLLLVYRDAPPFTDDQKQLLALFSTQLSLLIGNLAAREQIMSLAETDDLTGIWNRRYFRRQLPSEMERARVYNLPLSLGVAAFAMISGATMTDLIRRADERLYSAKRAGKNRYVSQ